VRVRKLGSGPLVTRAGTLNGGEETDLPREVVAAYAHKLEILEPLPAPKPAAPPPTEQSALDTSDMTVHEVLDAIEAGAFTAETALEAERAGRNRVTLITQLRDLA